MTYLRESISFTHKPLNSPVAIQSQRAKCFFLSFRHIVTSNLNDTIKVLQYTATRIEKYKALAKKYAHEASTLHGL